MQWCQHGFKITIKMNAIPLSWLYLYVAQVSAKNKCFADTFDPAEAKEYSEKSVKGILTKLDSFGESENNSFEAIEA